jgi:hypothetical protein
LNGFTQIYFLVTIIRKLAKQKHQRLCNTGITPETANIGENDFLPFDIFRTLKNQCRKNNTIISPFKNATKQKSPTVSGWGFI